MSKLLEAEKAIRDLLSAYCHSLDRGDIGAFVELFTDDCIWDGGQWGKTEGRQALRESKRAGVAASRIKTRHLSSSEAVSVTGDTATARSYVMVMNVSQSPPVPLVVGCYEDNFVQAGGKWFFKSRTLRNE